jgi:Sulfotransferase domain
MTTPVDGTNIRSDLPTFIGVGPPRTGTSWLDNIFRGHVNLPEGIKETLFFDVRYERGLDWYASYFRNRQQGVPTGEFAPSCFISVAARERIARHIPDCRIVCTLREPVARLYSNYKLWRQLALVKDPFERVAERHENLLSYTRYAANVAEWQRMFGRENTLVLIHEDALRDRQKYVDRICTFIGAPRLDLASVAQVDQAVAQVERAPKSRRLARRARQLRGFLANHRYLRTRNLMEPLFEFCAGRGEEFPPLDPALDKQLRQRFEPEVAAMEELLGRDLSLWRKSFPNAD